MTEATSYIDLTGEILLDALKKNQGKWLSGELLAERLSMTRAGIWKKIGILKGKGYVIESVPRKGYRLLDISDRMLPEEIRDGLHTAVLGKRDIHCYKCIDSTNKSAKELAAAGAVEGVLVIAEEQLRGRGRLDRPWFSSGGENICASVILRPLLAPDDASRIMLLACIAAAEALIDVARIGATVKWPNDIAVNGRKIGGILLEMSVEADAVDYMVIGLGLNVNTASHKFPEEIRNNATSVFVETGKHVSRVLVLRRFLELLEDGYKILLKAGFDAIKPRWIALTDIFGKKVSIRTKNRTCQGIVTDMDDNGFLIIRTGKGVDVRFFSGDITVL